jgi:hypothetical protein
MFTRSDTNNLDTSLFDPDHDMDLVALANNARTEDDVESVVRMSRSRMRARRAELRARETRRRGSGSWRNRLAPSALLRG